MNTLINIELPSQNFKMKIIFAKNCFGGHLAEKF